jgi:lipoprotein-releasing system permease protein
VVASVPFELFIALRYLLARRQHSSISRVSLFSTIGVAVGVVALVVALALMTGLQGELRNRILGSTAHVYVWKTGSLGNYESEVANLRSVPGVAGAGPAIIGKAIVSSDRTAAAFITLKGVDPVLEGHVTDIERTLKEGSLAGLTEQGEDDRPGMLLGYDLAQQLGAKVGDEITLTTPGGSLSPMGLIPRNRRVRVVGVFQLGLYEYDSGYGFVSLDFASKLFSKEAPDLIQLRVDDIWQAAAVAKSIPERLGPEYVSEDWS